jgi:hypothetical protein
MDSTIVIIIFGIPFFIIVVYGLIEEATHGPERRKIERMREQAERLEDFLKDF